MAIQLMLSFTDESGSERRVSIGSNRLTLGRDAANDVVIRDSNLSRHHAVIQNIRGSIQLSDCNSRNGTILNGHLIVGAVEVVDGDVINLGGSCQISVELRRVSPPSSPRFSLPVIAGGAVAIILLAAVILLALSVQTEPAKFANTNTIVDRPEKKPRTTQNLQPAPRDEASQNSEDQSDQIATAVKRVMTKLSKDSAPYISNAGLNDVKRQVEKYRGSTDLRERLRTVKQSCPEINAESQRISLRPALVMYAALADSEGQSGSNPMIAARRMTPRLLSLRATFGTETANSSLLLIAAYPYPFDPVIGSQRRTPHPLASKLVEVGGRRSTVDTSEARSVWFLREKNAITEESYALVIRLLAIGVIAENPQLYGIEAEPLLC